MIQIKEDTALDVLNIFKLKRETMKQDKSLAFYERAKKVIPGGTQTLSKYYDRHIKGVYPAYISHGKGCNVWDIDGNKYIDFTAALGPIVLGYDFFTINPFGNSLSLPLPKIEEVELAELLCKIISCAEMVRFFKTGSDATSAAVRLARAVTGKTNIICCGYHGWHDWYAYTLPYPKNRGTLWSGTYKVEYGNLINLEDYFKCYKPACFILEPMNRLCPEKANREYLNQVKYLCKVYGVILIFDEIIMGFRHALAGGQEYFDVCPDLATYSKAMANGYPIATLVGKRKLMQEMKDLQIGGTYSGEVHSIEMAIRTIDYIRKNNVIDGLWRKGQLLYTGIKELISKWKLGDSIRLRGLGPWMQIDFDNVKVKEYFLSKSIEGGILTFNAEHFIMHSHENKHIQKTLEVYDYAFYNISQGVVK